MADTPETITGEIVEIDPAIANMTPQRKKLLEGIESGKYKTVVDLCKAVGIDRSVYYDALKSKEFVGALMNGSQALIYASVPKIVNKMVQQAKAGSLFHQQTLLKMINVYQDGPLVVNNTQNNYTNITPEEEAEYNLRTRLVQLAIKKHGSIEEAIKQWT